MSIVSSPIELQYWAAKLADKIKAAAYFRPYCCLGLEILSTDKVNVRYNKKLS